MRFAGSTLDGEEYAKSGDGEMRPMALMKAAFFPFNVR